MSEERFIIYMRMLKNMIEEENILLTALDCSPEWVGSGWISAFEQLLKEAVNDKGDWIPYYVYDLNFGRNWHPGCVTDADGNDIPLSNLDELWALIQSDLENTFI